MSSLEKLEKSVEEREIMAKLSQGVPSMEDVNKSLENVGKTVKKKLDYGNIHSADEVRRGLKLADDLEKQVRKIFSEVDKLVVMAKQGSNFKGDAGLHLRGVGDRIIDSIKEGRYVANDISVARGALRGGY